MVTGLLKDSSLQTVDVQYQKMLNERGKAAASSAWRFSRRSRAKLLELLAQHDKSTKFSLAKTWSRGHLNALPFFTGSQVCEQLRSLAGADARHTPYAMKPAMDAENFERTSYKFVMKSEDTVDFMCEVLPHLPLHIFKKDGQVLAATHSIYLDGEDLPLYHKKASKDPDGAVLLRLRWYDVDDPDAFYAETKVSKNKVTREPAKKTRARIEKSSLMDLLQGRGLLGSPILEEFAKKIGLLHATPVIRTTSRRVCFQVPDDASLRITVDLDFEAVLEGVSKGVWQFEKKLGPYVHFASQDAVQYPLAIVEIKVQGALERKPDPCRAFFFCTCSIRLPVVWGR